MTTHSLKTVSLPAGASRTRQTYDSVARLAERLGPEARLPTFAELREQLSVSVVTLNRALAELETHKVLYRRHGVGIFVSPSLGQKNIAVVCNPRFFEGPEISPFWKILVEQAQGHMKVLHHAFSLHFAAPDSAAAPFEEAFRRSVQDRQIQGVLGVGLSPSAVAWIAEQNIPLVVFAGHAPHRVDIDNHRIVTLGVQRLADLGCRRIGLWLNHYPADMPADFWRHPETLRESPLIAPYREALAERGLVFDPALIRDSRVPLSGAAGPPPATFWEQGYQTALSVFGQEDTNSLTPDGIVSPSELFTQGIIVGLQRLGVSLGTDIHLASHANESSPILQPWADEITILEVSPAQLARTMLEMLEVQMTKRTNKAGHDTDEKGPTESLISLPLKVRTPNRESPTISRFQRSEE